MLTSGSTVTYTNADSPYYMRLGVVRSISPDGNHATVAFKREGNPPTIRTMRTGYLRPEPVFCVWCAQPLTGSTRGWISEQAGNICPLNNGGLHRS